MLARDEMEAVLKILLLSDILAPAFKNFYNPIFPYGHKSSTEALISFAENQEDQANVP